jgi:glycosyltransferase involved in cell wall biosynthesis
LSTDRARRVPSLWPGFTAAITMARIFVVADVPLLIDASLSLINRTGAHYIALDLCESFGGLGTVRRWRLSGRSLPPQLLRKIFGRAMLKELVHLRGRDVLLWPDFSGGKRVKRLFLDPLYVLRSRLDRDDIVLCHDIGPVTHRHLYDKTTVALYVDAYDRIAAKRPGIVFVSNASRDSFCALFGENFRFLEVIPLYVRTNAATGGVEPPSGVDTPFVLTVGALETRKNIGIAIDAYRESNLVSSGVRYVVVGSRGDAAEDVVARAARTPGVLLLGYVTDSQLRWLYQNASAFLLPSLLEGFGMPALEAAVHGLIPILSRDSALTEAIGGQGFQVDPFSVNDIARAISAVIALARPAREQLSDRLVAHAKAATYQRFIERWRALLLSETQPGPAGSPSGAT